MNSVEDQIRERVEEFVEELSTLIREAAMNAVGEALGNGATAAPARRGRPVGRKAATSKKKASRKKRGRPRSKARVDTGPVLAAIKASPGGIGVTEIAAGLKRHSSSVKPAVAELLEAGEIRKTGVRRGTKYHPKKA